MLPPSLDTVSARIPIVLSFLWVAVLGCYDPVESASTNPIIPSGGATPPPPGTQGGPGEVQENNHHNSQFIVESDEGVVLKGTISCAEPVTGNIQLDFLRLDETGRRELVHGTQVAQLGAWAERVPEDFGEVYIMAFADNDRNGPSELDPKASVGPIEIGTEAIAGIELRLVKDADMGALALSTSGQPPSGSPPPEGRPDATSGQASEEPGAAAGPSELPASVDPAAAPVAE